MSSRTAELLRATGMRDEEAENKAELFTRLETQLAAGPGAEILRYFVPGRIEVLGKHTDYAGGRSLLCTAERGFCIAGVAREDSLVRIHDCGRKETFEFAISPDLSVPHSTWRLYTAVVARRLSRNFPGAVRGADIALISDLPPAAGMSSSSALLVAVYAILSRVNRIAESEEYKANISSTEDLTGYLGCVENGQTFKSLTGDAGVGTFGGSEDHTAILCSEAGRLKQYSFCPVRLEATVPLASESIFVIGSSGVAANKTGAARERYNRASQATRSILEQWRRRTGSNAATLAEAARSSAHAPDQIRETLSATGGEGSSWLLNRFQQFWKESEEIIPEASAALLRGDLPRFGELVRESQLAAETLLQNQVPETIWLAKEACSLGASAASAFGAGFGGSVWALVPEGEASRFAERWREAYHRTAFAAATRSQFFVTGAGPSLTVL